MTSFNVFCSHHVGGRAGSIAFPKLPKFEDEIFHVIYDADKDCVDQIEALWKPLTGFVMALGPFRRIIRDYFINIHKDFS